MSISNYLDLLSHVGHEIECVTYGGGANVALECIDCNEVLIDFDEEQLDFDEEQFH